MSSNSPPSRHPPYSTFIRAIAFLAAYLPPAIGSNAFASMSGSNSALSLTLLVYLKCVGAAGEPLPALVHLLRHYGLPGFRREVWKLVRASYDNLSECDLTSDAGLLRQCVVSSYPGIDAQSLLGFYVAAAVKAGVETSDGVRSLAGRLREDESEGVPSPAPDGRTARVDDLGPAEGHTLDAGVSALPDASGRPNGRGRSADWSATEAMRILTEEVYDPEVMPPHSEAAIAFLTMLRALRRL